VGGGRISGGTSSALALLTGGAIIGLGLIGILSFAVTALLAVIIGFATLVFRQILILLLVITAPFAIACYILPNTEKAWKMWWTSFMGALLVFPIITGFISIGRVFSALSYKQGDGLLPQTVGLIAYFAPYFLLPTAFKLAGGLLTTIGGMANDRSRGPFDRLKKGRQQRVADRTDQLKSGSLYNENGVIGKNFGRRVNRLGLRAGAGAKGRFGFGATGRVALGNQANYEPEEIAKINPEFGRRMVDEDTMAAVAYGGDKRRLAQLKHFQNADGSADDTKINDAIARARSVGIDRRTQVAAAKQLAKSGKIISNQSEAQSLYSAASGGDQSLANDLKGSLQYTWRGVGRNDIGRDKMTDSFKEMSVADMGKLKPLGAEGLFGDPNTLIASMSDPNMGAEERDHVASLLVSASSSPYLNPTQQANIQRTLNTLEEAAIPTTPLPPGVAGPVVPSSPASDAGHAVRRARTRISRESAEARNILGVDKTE
jgi:hypothetical protein